LLTLLGVILSSSYARLTPDLYEGNSHARLGWFIVFFVAGLLGLDIFSFGVRLVKWFNGPRDFAGFFRAVVGADSSKQAATSYDPVSLDEAFDEAQPLARESDDIEEERRRDRSSSGMVEEEGQWSGSGSGSDSGFAGASGSARPSNVPSHPSPLRQGVSTQQRRGHRPELSLNILPLAHQRRDTSDSLRSGPSDATLHDNHNDGHYIRHTASSPDEVDYEKYGAARGAETRDTHVSLTTKLRIAAKYLHIFCLRILLVLGYMQLLSGIAVYSGTCRGAYLNGCMAHLIKGSIFFLFVSLLSPIFKYMTRADANTG
jgi:hypothetical protein